MPNVQPASFQPHNTRWMNAAERRLAQARLAEDAGEADKDDAEDSWVATYFDCNLTTHSLPSPNQGLIMAIKDPLVSLFSILAVSQLLGLSFVQYFPTCVLFTTLSFDFTMIIFGLDLLKRLDSILLLHCFSQRKFW